MIIFHLSIIIVHKQMSIDDLLVYLPISIFFPSLLLLIATHLSIIQIIPVLHIIVVLLVQIIVLLIAGLLTVGLLIAGLLTVSLLIAGLLTVGLLHQLLPDFQVKKVVQMSDIPISNYRFTHFKCLCNLLDSAIEPLQIIEIGDLVRLMCPFISVEPSFEQIGFKNRTIDIELLFDNIVVIYDSLYHLVDVIDLILDRLPSIHILDHIF